MAEEKLITLEETKKAYQEIMELLESSAAFYKQESKNDSFSLEIFQRQYCFAMQAACIQVALADGKFSKEELDFLLGVADNGDVVKLFNKGLSDDEKFSWEDLVTMSPYQASTHHVHILEKVEDIIDNWAFFVAYVAVRLPKDSGYVETILERTALIAQGIAGADGEITDFEKEQGALAITKILEKAIGNNLEKAKK